MLYTFKAEVISLWKVGSNCDHTVWLDWQYTCSRRNNVHTIYWICPIFLEKYKIWSKNFCIDFRIYCQLLCSSKFPFVKTCQKLIWADLQRNRNGLAAENSTYTVFITFQEKLRIALLTSFSLQGYLSFDIYVRTNSRGKGSTLTRATWPNET